jgi:hypothetical protein
MKTQLTHHRTWHWLLAISLPIMLLLQACGPSNATPTVSVEAIYTAAYQTNVAQHATELALTPPTATVTPTLMPTLPPLPTQGSSLPLATLALLPTSAAVGGGSTACDNAVYAGDVTIPDGTVIDAGKKFTKTWSILNKGTCTWDSTYKLKFDSGEQMGGVDTAVTGSIGSGSVAQISVAMVAPSANGSYTGTWRMHNAAGTVFGDFLTVVIKVGNGGPTATVTAGPSPTSAPSGCPSDKCTITLSANVPDFQVTFTSAKTGYSDCTFGSDNKTCTFTVPPHWDGTVTPSKGTWVFTPSSYSFTNVIGSVSKSFVAAQP